MSAPSDPAIREMRERAQAIGMRAQRDLQRLPPDTRPAIRAVGARDAMDELLISMGWGAVPRGRPESLAGRDAGASEPSTESVVQGAVRRLRAATDCVPTPGVLPEVELEDLIERVVTALAAVDAYLAHGRVEYATDQDRRAGHWRLYEAMADARSTSGPRRRGEASSRRPSDADATDVKPRRAGSEGGGS